MARHMRCEGGGCKAARFCQEWIGPEGVDSTAPALDETRHRDCLIMPIDTQYTDCTAARNADRVAPDWRRIGEVIAREIAPEIARRVREEQREGEQ